MPNRNSDFIYALSWANEKHWNQKRKGTDIPYISHLMAVTALVMEAGGSKEEVVAALLHDVIEDCEDVEQADIEERFGERVTEIVLALSDADIREGEEKPEWKIRKEKYIAHLTECTDQSVLIVSLADKLHNARSILADLHDPLVGADVWSRFNAGSEEQLWYYRLLVSVFDKCAPNKRLAREFKQVVADIEAQSKALDDAIFRTIPEFLSKYSSKEKQLRKSKRRFKFILIAAVILVGVITVLYGFA
jgi:(p)ppGpp synthase/HD superfamily hydrolase